MADNILVTIAARGGSKGIKDKNIRSLNGKPLIYYTIKQALAWNKTDNVIVSTDSKEIAKISKKCGAQVPFMRPKSLATDKTGKVSVIKHALRQAEKLYDQKFNIVVDLDVTAPVRTVKDLDQCLNLFLKKKAKTLFTVVPAHKNPYFNMVEKTPKGKIKLCKNLKNGVLRRQDAPKVYDANASIYFYDRQYLLNSKKPSLINNRCEVYVMPEVSGFDIDRKVDFDFLEFLIKKRIVNLKNE